MPSRLLKSNRDETQVIGSQVKISFTLKFIMHVTVSGWGLRKWSWKNWKDRHQKGRVPGSRWSKQSYILTCTGAILFADVPEPTDETRSHTLRTLTSAWSSWKAVVTEGAVNKCKQWLNHPCCSLHSSFRMYNILLKISCAFGLQSLNQPQFFFNSFFFYRYPVNFVQEKRKILVKYTPTKTPGCSRLDSCSDVEAMFRRSQGTCRISITTFKGTFCRL